jgi:hypothetical protein
VLYFTANLKALVTHADIVTVVDTGVDNVVLQDLTSALIDTELELLPVFSTCKTAQST